MALAAEKPHSRRKPGPTLQRLRRRLSGSRLSPGMRFLNAPPEETAPRSTERLSAERLGYNCEWRLTRACSIRRHQARPLRGPARMPGRRPLRLDYRPRRPAARIRQRRDPALARLSLRTAVAMNSDATQTGPRASR